VRRFAALFGPAFRVFGPAKVEPPSGEQWTAEKGWHRREQ
jgi:hypothetical protein